MIVLYSRDHRDVGVAHEKISLLKTSLTFPDNNEAVSVSPNKPSDNPKHFQQVAMKFQKILNEIF